MLLVSEVHNINTAQLQRFIKAIRDSLWVLQDKKLAVWGLSFKPHTDDVRSSVAVELVRHLVAEGAHVTATDPKGMDSFRSFEPELAAKISLVDDPLEAVDGAEALIVATEWPEFGEVSLSEVKKRLIAPLVFDGRNLLDPATMKEMGYTYHCIGRNSVAKS